MPCFESSTSQISSLSKKNQDAIASMCSGMHSKYVKKHVFVSNDWKWVVEYYDL